MTYGTIIKQAREDERLTQEQLAEQLDVSRQAVSKWEADLSRPTREKLDRLSEILDIPAETWAAIDAEEEAARRPPDTSRPWKLATAALAAVCLILAVCLAVSLRARPAPAPEDPPPEVDLPVVPVPEEVEDAYADFPDVLPLSVRRDFDFGDWPTGGYDPAEVAYLEDGEKVMENELWCDWFPDGTRLSLVKASAYWDQTAARANIYLLWAPPVETTGGELEYHILLRIGEDYFGEDCGDLEAGPFENVLGYDGFKITMSHADNFYRDSTYIAPGPDGVPRMMTTSGELGHEADIDDDGVLEIVSFNRYLPGWEIIDTTEGEEGAFTYEVDYNSINEVLPLEVMFDFNPERGGFLLVDGDNAVVSRYVLRDGELVRLPPTDFSVADYPDVAGTKLTFITDDRAGILSDKIDPDDILPYTPDIRITHRQQAYLALQELYHITGLKVDECYCAASEFGVNFSLLPDGFNQRGFFSFGFNTRYGSSDNIPSVYISWKELDNDWSPLSLAEADRPGSGVEKEDALLWYYDRMKIFSTEAVSYVEFENLWLENGDRYVSYDGIKETEYGPVLTSLTGPYPDGVVNH